MSGTAGRVELTLGLTPAAAVSGRVVNDAGQPVGGAQVLLVTPGHSPVISETRVHEQGCPAVRTGADGRFSFPSPGEQVPWLAVAVADFGYAEADAAALALADGALQLQPWATVTGQLFVGNQPGVGETIWGQPRFTTPFDPGKPRASYELRAKTDAAGRFVLARVPPGELALGREIHLADRPGREDPRQ